MLCAYLWPTHFLCVCCAFAGQVSVTAFEQGRLLGALRRGLGRSVDDATSLVGVALGLLDAAVGALEEVRLPKLNRCMCVGM